MTNSVDTDDKILLYKLITITVLVALILVLFLVALIFYFDTTWLEMYEQKKQAILNNTTLSSVESDKALNDLYNTFQNKLMILKIKD